MGQEKNFNFLNQLINNTGEKLILNEDIKLSGFSERMKFKSGIELEKDNFIIDGKGHSIDANGKARIFQIKGQNIILKNIIFKNGKGDYGGALRNEGQVELMNCQFEGNNVSNHGCDISNTPGCEVKIIDCEFAQKEDAIWNRSIVKVWESQIDEMRNYITGGDITTFNITAAPKYDEVKIQRSMSDSKIFDVFLSFKSDDNKITHEVYDFLEDNDVNCWMSEKDLPGAVSFGKEIVNALDNAKSVLLIYSQNTPKSEWVKRELYYAARNNVHIFPFIVDDSKDIINEIAFIISSNNWVFLDKENREISFGEIQEALNAIENRK